MNDDEGQSHTLGSEDVTPALIHKTICRHLCEVVDCPECAERDEYGRIKHVEVWE